MEKKYFYNFISLSLSILFIKNKKNENMNNFFQNMNDRIFFLKKNMNIVLNSVVNDKNKSIIKNNVYNVFSGIKTISNKIYNQTFAKSINCIKKEKDNNLIIQIENLNKQIENLN